MRIIENCFYFISKLYENRLFKFWFYFSRIRYSWHYYAGLPGFPFLLLTVFCFSRSSERVHNWFLQTEIYQKHVLPLKKIGMRKKTKYNILIFATIMMAIAFLLYTQCGWQIDHSYCLSH